MEKTKESGSIKFADTPMTKETKKQKTVQAIAKSPNKWEIKDRIYYLLGNNKPISYTIQSKNIMWFDKDKGYEREVSNTINQNTPFVDEFKGDARLEHIAFIDGMLFVPKEKTVLQKILSLHHPKKDTLYYEWQPEVEAEDELDDLEFEIDALNIARDMDIDTAEAIMRVEIGSEVNNMSTKELRRDLLVFARNNPDLFIELAEDDNVHLRNVGIKAVESNIIKLSPDNRNFSWASNNRVLMTVPFDEHPYSALAAWFKTDEGMEIHSTIEKKLS
jgi:hypothetical protein